MEICSHCILYAQFSPHTVDFCCVQCMKSFEKVTSISDCKCSGFLYRSKAFSHLQIKSIRIHLFEEKIAITNIFKQLAFCKSMHSSINPKIPIYSTVTWNKTLLSWIREMSARNRYNHYQNTNLVSFETLQWFGSWKHSSNLKVKNQELFWC